MLSSAKSVTYVTLGAVVVVDTFRTTICFYLIFLDSDFGTAGASSISKTVENSLVTRVLTSSIGTCVPVSSIIEVITLGSRPQGLIRRKYDRSGFTFSANP